MHFRCITASPGVSFSGGGGGEARFAAAARRSTVAWEHTGEAALDAWMSGLFFGAMVDEELDADLLEDLKVDEELEEDLDEEHEADEELEVDLDEEHEADEDEIGACAPYLARQMSCLGSRTPGVKNTPF